jgi:hypothetical protein
VRFPGLADISEWPPPRFDFTTPWMRGPELRFERDAGGGIGIIRRFDHVRLVADIERAHLMFDIAPGTRDFLLLRLVPSALRFVETVAPGDPVPGPLRDADTDVPAEHHIYAATTMLMELLAGTATEEAMALSDAIRRVPPGPEMFEQAVIRCVTRDLMPVERVAPLARRLQRLANAHAGALAAAANQPDYLAMEHMMRAMHATIGSDRRWANDLLTLAMASLLPIIDRPRLTAEALLRQAETAMRRPGALHALPALIEAQQAMRERLSELALFWGRTAAAWLAVDPDTTDRREVEALARNAMRRLSLASLYRVES